MLWLLLTGVALYIGAIWLGLALSRAAGES